MGKMGYVEVIVRSQRAHGLSRSDHGMWQLALPETTCATVPRVALPRKILGITIQRLIGVNMEPLLLGTELDAE